MIHDIVTTIRDPRNVLGKQFVIDAAGKTSKRSTVTTSVAIATQHHVPDVGALQELLGSVAEDCHMAVTNTVFPSVPVGQDFLLMSEYELKRRGFARRDDSIVWPVEVEHAGWSYPTLGRFKEHSACSSWLILDRDVDCHTPTQYATLNYDEWLRCVDLLLPGVMDCARLHAHSSSARVVIGGKPVGSGNGHTWVQLSDATDLDRLRNAVMARALALDMAWQKPRRSRATGEIVGYGLASLIDWSVMNRGRLVFVGKPVIQHV